METEWWKEGSSSRERDLGGRRLPLFYPLVVGASEGDAGRNRVPCHLLREEAFEHEGIKEGRRREKV